MRRRPPWPLWAVGVVLGWAGLAWAATSLAARLGREASLCLFRRLTTLPCPTCGAWRGLTCLLRGDPAAAWLLNPLLATVVAGLALSVVARVVFARRVCVAWTRPARIAAWAAAGALFLANWAYVMLVVG